MLALSLLSLAGVAVASPISSVARYARAIEDRAVSVTTQDLSNFQFYVQHAAAAYCNVGAAAGAAVTCTENACPDVQGDKATIVSSFVGDDTGIGGYVSTDAARKEIVVSFRGSSNIRNWIANLDFVQSSCDLVSGCGVHSGFMNAWEEVADNVKAAVTSASKANPTYKIFTAGHSLGGAVATLAAAYLRKDGGFAVDVYSYGSPRVGDNDFATFVTQQAGGEYRVTHGDDPVPRLPPIVFGYRHTAPEYWLKANTTTYTVNDITVCEGTANIKCNGGTLGLDIDAHSEYFRATSACAPDGIAWRSTEPTDAELEAKVNEYVRMDKEFVANNDV